ncbi:ATP-dependent helicase [Arthrobacter sp. zg-Y877]|uniref:ATP-dependent helicase n=1 Tax=Arthrobacter sp. zg-Y877 TaxID=3049074 RepID=UPI0025A4BD8E|nr:ATP-dependent helicase [Arthrobacter sp. zg-Y877]MDM7989079.1 ATP-dependent helicase [Arthrobacter sp. zg-Y877]
MCGVNYRTRGKRISLRVGLELKKLDEDQREAVHFDGNVVVTAGPGSGKTLTLVARAAFLLSEKVSPFRAVACITYTRAAAGEIGERIAKLGPDLGKRVVARTFHSFCLTEILIPFSQLIGVDPPKRDGVVPTDSLDSSECLSEAFDELGINYLVPTYWVPTLTKIRRDMWLGESLDAYDPREVEAVRLFEQKMRARGLIDFEAMTSRALLIMEQSKQARDLFQAKFPHLLIDEYQDLGGVLHSLVECLRSRAGVTIFAVGDVDQSMYEFNGAKPDYLQSLVSNSEYRAFRLTRNYRSSANLFPLFAAALCRGPGTHSRPNDESLLGDGGIYEIVEVPSGAGLAHHSELVVHHVVRLLREGVLAEKIAILYNGKGPMRDSLIEELEFSGISFFDHRSEDLPSGDLFELVRLCAQRVNGLIRQGSRGDPDPSLEALAAEYRRFSGAHYESPVDRVLLLARVQEIIDYAVSDLYAASPSQWVAKLAEHLGLEAVERVSSSSDSRLSDIIHHAEQFNQMENYLQSLNPFDKVNLMTFWGAKGLGFEAVIIPGLVNGVFPREVKNRDGRWSLPTGRALDEVRRTFYVALTRAEREVVLIGGSQYFPRHGDQTWVKRTGVSVLLQELRLELARQRGSQ